MYTIVFLHISVLCSVKAAFRSILIDPPFHESKKTAVASHHVMNHLVDGIRRKTVSKGTP